MRVGGRHDLGLPTKETGDDGDGCRCGIGFDLVIRPLGLGAGVLTHCQPVRISLRRDVGVFDHSGMTKADVHSSGQPMVTTEQQGDQSQINDSVKCLKSVVVLTPLHPSILDHCFYKPP